MPKDLLYIRLTTVIILFLFAPVVDAMTPKSTHASHTRRKTDERKLKKTFNEAKRTNDEKLCCEIDKSRQSAAQAHQNSPVEHS